MSCEWVVKMGFCSAVTLAFATIFSLVAVALLAIAFSTDEWINISVERDTIKKDIDIKVNKIQENATSVWCLSSLY